MDTGILNENPNDFNWRNKLDDTERLAAETLPDKNAAWEKLHRRLNQNRGRKRFVWYWAAAAGLLAVMVTSLLSTHKKEVAAMKNIQPAIINQKQVKKDIAPSKEMAAAIIPSVLIEKKAAIKAVVKINNSKHSANDPLTATTASTIFNDQKYPQHGMDISQSSTLAVPPLVKAAALPAKNKLRVVHINELGNPVEETRNFAHIEDYRSFQSRLINPEVSPGSAVLYSNTGFNIFKTKNTP